MSTTMATDETVCWLHAGDESILGVVTRPFGPARGVGVIILNGGHGGSSAGKNHVNARLAAALAERGFHSIRFEWRGIGDSTGEVDEFVYDEPFVAEALAAADALHDEGVERVAIYGECFGARTAIVAADRLPHLVAAYLVTLLVRDGPVSDQRSQRYVADLPTTEFVKRVGKLRHVLDPQRRAIYTKIVRSKARQVLGAVRRTVKGERLPPWVGSQVTEGLPALARRGVSVKLVYGTSNWDRHTIDYQAMRDDLDELRTGTIDDEIIDEMIAGYRSLHVQERLISMATDWFDSVLPAAQPAAATSELQAERST